MFESGLVSWRYYTSVMVMDTTSSSENSYHRAQRSNLFQYCRGCRVATLL